MAFFQPLARGRKMSPLRRGPAPRSGGWEDDLLVRRLPGWPSWLQLVVSPLGATAGAVLVGSLQGAPLLPFAGLGLLIGAGLAFASRAYDLIVIDVLGTPPDRPLKGTMLFGFAFALALAYHYIRFFWNGPGPIAGD